MEHFEEIKDGAQVVVHARCIYYSKIYNFHSKKHGRNHILTCMKNHHDRNNRQKLLILQPVCNTMEANNTKPLDFLGT